MVVQFNDETEPARRLRVHLEHRHGCDVLVDEAGEIYGSGDWYRLRGAVIHAAPHERAHMPEWLRQK